MRWLKEPLLHFILIGLCLFALYAWLNPDEMSDDRRIVVTAGTINSLAAGFSRTWNRAPTAEELENLVDGFIVEEIYYRQALAIGLDRDDPVVRRRLRQKMEFITADVGEMMEPAEAELQRYLETNPDAFSRDPRLSFEQVYFPADTDEDEIERSKAQLNAGSAVPANRTLLPAAMEAAPAFAIDRQFGEGFSRQIEALPRNTWSGPVRTGFGLHLVRLSTLEPGYLPPLEEVRREVEREWRVEQNRKIKQRMIDRLTAQYDISVDWPGEAGSGNSST